MKRIICALAVTLLCGPLVAMAQDKPTPEEARKVINYYFNGKSQGVVLIEYKICKEISKKGETKNECVTEILNKTVAKGEEVYLWMNFLVPVGEKSKILLRIPARTKFETPRMLHWAVRRVSGPGKRFRRPRRGIGK